MWCWNQRPWWIHCPQETNLSCNATDKCSSENSKCFITCTSGKWRGIMKRKIKWRWLTTPPISTKWTITSHFKRLNINKRGPGFPITYSSHFKRLNINKRGPGFPMTYIICHWKSRSTLVYVPSFEVRGDCSFQTVMVFFVFHDLNLIAFWLCKG